MLVAFTANIEIWHIQLVEDVGEQKLILRVYKLTCKIENQCRCWFPILLTLCGS